MSAFRGGRHYEDATFGIGGFKELDPPAPKLAVVTGYHCFEVAKRLCNPFGPIEALGRASGDGQRASFTALYNGRMYRVSVEPDHIGGNKA